MRSFTQIIKGHHGKHDKCKVCGGDESPVQPLDNALASTYTDHHMSTNGAGDWLCDACINVMSGRPPNTFRTVSMLWTPNNPYATDVERFAALADRASDDVWIGNKKDMRPIADALCGMIDGPWIVSVADSGKIHTAPFATANNGSDPWVVRFERNDVACDPDTFKDLLIKVNRLITYGFSRASIEKYEPKIHELVKLGIDKWTSCDLSSFANSHVLALAVNISKKDHADETISRLDGGSCEHSGAGMYEVSRYRQDRSEELVVKSEESPRRQLGLF